MADLAPSISQLTKTCQHEFDELSSSHRDAVKRIGYDTLTEPPTALDLLAWVLEQKTKLNLFADVLGVFAHGSLSVEHRLRNNSAVRSSVAQLLEAISKNLCLCIRSRVQLVEHQRTTDDDTIEPAPAYDVTKIACRRIGRDVANLVRFAALIRLRSMQQYRERSEHHEPLDHDGLPLGDYFDKVVTRVLKETFEDTDMGGLLDGPSQDTQRSVPQRIKQTVTSRWKRICYHIARYQQLRGSDSPVEENMDDEDIAMEDVQLDADVKHAVPLRGDRVHASTNLVVPQHERATTFQGSLNEQVKVPQPPSITPSVALTNVAGFSVRMPRLRKQDVTYENGMLNFLCPLCKIPQQLPSEKSAVHQHRAWEKHAFYDLEPYICVLDCRTPEATYRTFEDWTRHINNEHARYTWQCQNCTESCDNQAAFEQHLRSQHEAKLTAGELAFVAKTCERPVAAFSACFFCGKYELSVQTQAESKDAAAVRERKMMHCMAQHMRSMALTSLPDQLSVSDGSAESAARVSDASEASAPFRTVTQSKSQSTDPRSEAFESILSQLKVQYEVTDGRADFTNEWRLKSDLMSSDNRPADLPQLMLDPETLSQQYWESTLDLDCVGEGPPRYDGMPLTFDHDKPSSDAVPMISSYWSVPEQTDFAKYIAHFGTDFAAIAEHMRTKSQLQVKNHFQRQVDGGRAHLAEQAEQANQRRKRGEDMGPPPTPTPISKRKYDTLETSVSHGTPSQTLPTPLDVDSPEPALVTAQKPTDGGTGVLPAMEDDEYIFPELHGFPETEEWDRRLSDVQDEGFASLQTYPGPPQQNGQGGRPSRSMTLPGMDQNGPKSPAFNKRHKCPYCATEFTQHHNLRSHVLTHSQEKRYVCQTCQARFRRLHDLKRHTKLHTGARPHACDKCGRSFARDDALARHNKAPGGCAGGQSSLEDKDDNGGGTYNSLDEAATSRNAAPSTIEGDEHTSHDVDLAGDLKVSNSGQLRGGREYQCRTFTLPGRGTTIYMLATECARVLGYRDSDILFNENQTLDKIVVGQAEKDDLLDRNILPRFDRARQVAVVTARSIFRQFGNRVIEDGQPGRDDYWEADAQHQVLAGFDLLSSGLGDEFPSHSGTRDLVGNTPSEVYDAVSPVHMPIDSTSADTSRDPQNSRPSRKRRKWLATRCLACSELNIHCDLGMEGCMQCEKAGIPCRMVSTNAESPRDPNELRNQLEAQQGHVESCLACRERKVPCDPGDNGCLQCAERGTPCRMLSRRRVKPSGPTFQYPMPLEQHETTQSKAAEIARPGDSMDVDTDDEDGQVLLQARVHDQLGGPFNTVSF